MATWMEVVEGLRGSVDPDYLELLQSTSDTIRTELVNDLQNSGALTSDQYDALTNAILQEGQVEEELGQMTELMDETPEQREQILAERAMRQEQEARELGMPVGGSGLVTEEATPALFSVLAGEKFGKQDPSLLRKGSALLADFGAAPSRALGIEGPQANQSGPEQFLRYLATDPTLPYSIGLGGIGAVARPAVGVLKNLKRGLGFGATEGAIASGVDYGGTGEANLGTNIGLGLLTGGLSGGMEAGRVRLGGGKKEPKPIQVDPSAKPMQQGQQMVAQAGQEAESMTPQWIAPKDWEQLPQQLKRAVNLTENKPEYKDFYFEMDKAAKKYNQGGKDVFQTLAESKGKEAFDAYQNKLETTGNRIREVRNKYIPEARNFDSFDEFGQGLGLEDVMQMDVDANGVPQVKFLDASNNNRTLTQGKLTAGQKLLKNFFDSDDKITVSDLKRFRDTTFKDKIKNKKDVDASVMEVYTAANKLLDSKIEEAITAKAPMGSNVYDQFLKDKRDFADLAAGERELNKAFGEEKTIINLEDVPADEARKLTRAKFSQRLKTMSKNPQNWEVPAEILESVSGVPLRDYADLTRAAAVANNIDAGLGFTEVQKQGFQNIASALKPQGKIGAVFEGAKKIKGALSPEITQDQRLGGMMAQSGIMQGPRGLQRFAQQPLLGAGARGSFVPLTAGLRALTADYEEQQ